MRSMELLAFSFLAVILISSGTVSTFAQSNDNDDGHTNLERQVLPTASFDLEIDRSLYANGQAVSVNGLIPGFADQQFKNSVTFKVLHLTESTDTTDAHLKMLALGQVVPANDGSFAFSFKAGGPLWTLDDKYHVVAYYGGNSRDVVSFDFRGADTDLFNDEPVQPSPPAGSTTESPSTTDDLIAPPPPPPPPPSEPTCGPGTELVDGMCQAISDPGSETTTPPPPPSDDNGGCLIATATYGTELAPQVQFLREIRDNTLLSTGSGTSFMTGFNQIYYSFSPTVADLERDNPVFRDMVRTAITPMISTLSIMTLADPGSESQVLGFGISIIMLNLAIYIVAPVLVVVGVSKYLKSRRRRKIMTTAA